MGKQFVQDIFLATGNRKCVFRIHISTIFFQPTVKYGEFTIISSLDFYLMKVRPRLTKKLTLENIFNWFVKYLHHSYVTLFRKIKKNLNPRCEHVSLLIEIVHSSI